MTLLNVKNMSHRFVFFFNVEEKEYDGTPEGVEWDLIRFFCAETFSVTSRL